VKGDDGKPSAGLEHAERVLDQIDTSYRN